MAEPKKFYDRLAGLSAIVTGAGSQGEGYGIGKAIACSFAREGARVCLVDSRQDRAEETLELITAAGGSAFVACGDVTDPADCARIVADTAERHGGVDVLVNNVGVGKPVYTVEDIDPDAWDRIMAVNVRSAMLMTRAAMPHLVKQGGSIINMSSIAAQRAIGDLGAYPPSKAALIALTAEIASLYGRKGVRANVIAPGHMFTPMVVPYLDAELTESRRKFAPLGVQGDAWDIASAAVFLASDDARFITGACLPVDGGASVNAAPRVQALLRD